MSLPWVCTHCATRHDTTEQRLKCERDRRSTTILAVSVLVGIAVVVLAAMIAWNIYVYGDWTCAFAECRKVKVVP